MLIAARTLHFRVALPLGLLCAMAAATTATADPARAPAAPAPSRADLTEQASTGRRVTGAESNQKVIPTTGTAIKRKEAMTPAPVVVIDRQLLLGSGMVTAGMILRYAPAGRNGVQVEKGPDGSLLLNMRGLGVGRSLVLLNGRR